MCSTSNGKKRLLPVGSVRNSLPFTEAMKLACVREIAALAKQDVSDEVAAAYQGKELKFGPDYLIPKLTDPRLLGRVAPAVARAAVESGVAQRRPDIE